MVLAQAESQIPRDRIERGGLNIITTLDYDLQKQASCVTEVYAARMAGLTEPEQDCESAGLLPSLPPAVTLADSSASALILDPNNGQVLALVGETVQGVETPLVTAHSPGSSFGCVCLFDRIHPGLESSLVDVGYSQRRQSSKTLTVNFTDPCVCELRWRMIIRCLWKR